MRQAWVREAWCRRRCKAGQVRRRENGKLTRRYLTQVDFLVPFSYRRQRGHVRLPCRSLLPHLVIVRTARGERVVKRVRRGFGGMRGFFSFQGDGPFLGVSTLLSSDRSVLSARPRPRGVGNNSRHLPTPKIGVYRDNRVGPASAASRLRLISALGSSRLHLITLGPP